MASLSLIRFLHYLRSVGQQANSWQTLGWWNKVEQQIYIVNTQVLMFYDLWKKEENRNVFYMTQYAQAHGLIYIFSFDLSRVVNFSLSISFPLCHSFFRSLFIIFLFSQEFYEIKGAPIKRVYIYLSILFCHIYA